MATYSNSKQLMQDDGTGISEEALLRLEKSNPDLVQQYREKMAASKVGMASAQGAQDMGNYANIGGRVLNDLNNANKTDVVLKNTWQALGKTPSVVEAKRPAYDDSVINNITGQGVARAKDDMRLADAEFSQEQTLVDLGSKRDDQQKSRDLLARMNDPTSQESFAAREYLKRIVPDAGKLAGFDGMTAAQVEKMSPGLYSSYNAEENRKSQEAYRREMAAQTARNQQAFRTERAERTADERKYKDELRLAAELEKKKGQVVEVEDRRSNIKDNIKMLREKIKANGTFEMFGSHNQDLERITDAIATDMAKLMDPSSVARPSEVESIKKNLIKSGFQNTNETALQILDNFEKEVDARAGQAYTVRGLEAPQQNSVKPTVKMQDPSGKTYQVPAENVEAAKAKGWK
jgi:hypothetical protein